MKNLLNRLAGWCIALVVLMWRQTCRIAFEHDPRPELRAQKQPYVMALLHAHQVSAVLANDEKHMAAMVSRSADGDLLVPSLRLRRVQAVRGSSRRNGRDKGGATALLTLARLTASGIPTLLAVDGPRGPRNHVQPGIATLARRSGAVILPTIAIASKRWLLQRTWDRMQLPKPGAQLRVIFGPPIPADTNLADAVVCHQVEAALALLEATYD